MLIILAVYFGPQSARLGHDSRPKATVPANTVPWTSVPIEDRDAAQSQG